MSRTRAGALGLSLLLLLVSLVSLVACGDVEPPSGELAPSEITQEIRLAFAQGSRLERTRRLAPLLDRLRPENLTAVLAAYDEYMVGLWPTEIQLLMDAWTRFDGPAAFAYARNMGFEGRRPEALEAAVFGWAHHDPTAARTAVESAIESGFLGRRMRVPLVQGWIESGRPGFESLLRAPAGSEDLRVVALRGVYRLRGIEGLLIQAERQIDNDPGLEGRVLSFQTAVDIAVSVDLAQAKGWVEKYANETFSRSGPAHVAQQWAKTQPEETFEWLRTAPAPSQSEGVRAGFRSWFRRDPEAATAWLAEQSPEPFYDPAHFVMARSLDRSSSREAIDACRRISQSDAATRCLVAVVSRWYRGDQTAAEAWLAESSLDPDAQRKIREGARRRGSGGPNRGVSRKDSDGSPSPDR